MSDAEPEDPDFAALIAYIQEHREVDFRVTKDRRCGGEAAYG